MQELFKSSTRPSGKLPRSNSPYNPKLALTPEQSQNRPSLSRVRIRPRGEEKTDVSEDSGSRGDGRSLFVVLILKLNNSSATPLHTKVTLAKPSLNFDLFFPSKSPTSKHLPTAVCYSIHSICIQLIQNLLRNNSHLLLAMNLVLLYRN